MTQNIKDSSIENFVCPITTCLKKFRQEKYLKSHMQMHDDINEKVNKKINKKKDKINKANTDTICIESLISENLVANTELSDSTNSIIPTNIFCKICHNEFRQISQLKEHEILHEMEMPYKCSFCFELFAVLLTFKNHLKTHNYNGSVNDIHKMKFDELRKESYIIEKAFLCNKCGETRETEELIIEHEQMHKGEEPFKCSECEQYFAVEEKYQNHIKSHLTENKFNCKTTS